MPILLFVPLLLALVSLPLQAASSLIPSPPKLAATGYILIDYDSGQLLAADKPETRLEPASLTKMLAAYTVFHEVLNGRINLTDPVQISEKAWRMEGSRMFVEVNSKVSVEALLKGVMIQSGNDATVALAEYVAGSEEAFAHLMNEHARTLGMTNSHFVNATGLPHPDHYTTPHDMSLLATALIREHPDYYAWYSERKFKYNEIEQYNRNKLLWRDPSVDGIKTGHTEAAGYCLVASAKRDAMRLISVVMGTRSENARAQESQKLLNYGFRFFETHRLYGTDEPLKTMRIWKGDQEQLELGIDDDLYVTVPRGQYDKLSASMTVEQQLIAPVKQGQQLGTVTVKLGEETLSETPLRARQSVAKGSLFDRLVDHLIMMTE